MSIGKDFTLNLQGGKKIYEEGDVAPEPLFSNVSANLFTNKPTYAAFYALLDNYVAESGTAEIFTDFEKREMERFLDAVCETPAMIYLYKYVMAKFA